MPIATKSAEECGRRWVEGSSLAVRDALENPRTEAEYDWALGFAAGNLRKLTPKGNSQANLSLSAALLQEAGLDRRERVLTLALPEGGLLVRRATEEDIINAHAIYSTTPRPTFPPKPAPENLPDVEKICPQCTLAFRTRQQRRVYCDACRRERLRASWRDTWRRRGKLRLSYYRRLKGAGLACKSHARPAGSLRLPLDGETGSDPSSTRPADCQFTDPRRGPKSCPILRSGAHDVDPLTRLGHLVESTARTSLADRSEPRILHTGIAEGSRR
jgi:hypothetical protein